MVDPTHSCPCLVMGSHLLASATHRSWRTTDASSSQLRKRPVLHTSTQRPRAILQDLSPAELPAQGPISRDLGSPCRAREVDMETPALRAGLQAPCGSSAAAFPAMLAGVPQDPAPLCHNCSMLQTCPRTSRATLSIWSQTKMQDFTHKACYAKLDLWFTSVSNTAPTCLLLNFFVTLCRAALFPQLPSREERPQSTC